MTPFEARTIDRLEKAWKAKAHKMPSDWSLRWMFCRAPEDEVVDDGSTRPRAVAMCEVIETTKGWPELAREGVMVRPECWKLARTMGGISKLPLMVVVIAQGEARFLKVTEFGPEHLETRRLPVPDFRPLFRVDGPEEAGRQNADNPGRAT